VQIENSYIKKLITKKFLLAIAIIAMIVVGTIITKSWSVIWAILFVGGYTIYDLIDTIEKAKRDKYVIKYVQVMDAEHGKNFLHQPTVTYLFAVLNDDGSRTETEEQCVMEVSGRKQNNAYHYVTGGKYALVFCPTGNEELGVGNIAASFSLDTVNGADAS